MKMIDPTMKTSPQLMLDQAYHYPEVTTQLYDSPREHYRKDE
jgi:hypothetical protein